MKRILSMPAVNKGMKFAPALRAYAGLRPLSGLAAYAKRYCNTYFNPTLIELTKNSKPHSAPLWLRVVALTQYPYINFPYILLWINSAGQSKI